MPDCVNSSFPYRVRPMTLEDVDQVAQVEKLCFHFPGRRTLTGGTRYGGNTTTWWWRESRTEGAGSWVLRLLAHRGGDPRFHHRVHPSIGAWDWEVPAGSDARWDGEECLLSHARSSVSHPPPSASTASMASASPAGGRRYYRDNHEDALVMEVESLSAIVTGLRLSGGGRR